VKLSVFLLVAAAAAALVLVGTATAGDVFNGRTVYETYCLACHGESGRPIDPAIPSFADGDAIFKPDSQLLDQVRQGSEAMPAFRGVLTESEIIDVITYIRSL